MAADAAARGADVVLVTTRADHAPTGVRVLPVETASEMAAACSIEAPGADLVVMAAAVADFRPERKADGKPVYTPLTGMSLLIFFMLSSSFITPNLPLVLPSVVW